MTLEDAGQLNLLGGPDPDKPRRRAFATRDPLEAALAWKKANPKGWLDLVDLAFKDYRAERRCSMKYYLEVLRKPWAYAIRKPDDEAYVINNNAGAGFVRLLIKEYPQLAGSFETRRSRADGAA
jgi:hypothetical protein